MDDKVLRVAVISTGWISSLAIRAIVRRPHLELVGVWVHSAEKTGTRRRRNRRPGSDRRDDDQRPRRHHRAETRLRRIRCSQR